MHFHSYALREIHSALGKNEDWAQRYAGMLYALLSLCSQNKYEKKIGRGLQNPIFQEALREAQGGMRLVGENHQITMQKESVVAILLLTLYCIGGLVRQSRKVLEQKDDKQREDVTSRIYSYIAFLQSLSFNVVGPVVRDDVVVAEIIKLAASTLDITETLWEWLGDDAQVSMVISTVRDFAHQIKGSAQESDMIVESQFSPLPPENIQRAGISTPNPRDFLPKDSSDEWCFKVILDGEEYRASFMETGTVLSCEKCGMLGFNEVKLHEACLVTDWGERVPVTIAVLKRLLTMRFPAHTVCPICGGKRFEAMCLFIKDALMQYYEDVEVIV